MMIVISGMKRNGPTFKGKRSKFANTPIIDKVLTRNAHTTSTITNVFRNLFCDVAESVVLGNASLNSRCNK